MRNLFLLLGLTLFISSCQVEPKPIAYNHDECAYCKMKISDVKFGAELVTKKGKIYKYDSAECLVRTYLETNPSDYAFVLVTDFSKPQQLIDATSSTFLISEAQPSPMGGNLSAYENEEEASAIHKVKGGELLNFNQLLETYKAIYQ